MADFQHSLDFLDEVQVRNGIEGSDFPRVYNLITVQGLGSGDSDGVVFPWQKNGSDSPVADIQTYLSFNDTQSFSYNFHYSISPQNRCIDEETVISLARALLDALQDTYTRTTENFVLLGRDLGGLIIKEALYLARWTAKYHFVAGRTTVLIFYETPHWAIPTESSWENLANWMLSISGWKCLSSVNWIYGTARMIESVCKDFEGSQRLYDVINVSSIESPDSGWERKAKALGWSTVLCKTDLSNSNEALAKVCQKIKSSSEPGLPFIQSLNMLGIMSLARVYSPVPPEPKVRTRKRVSDVVRTHGIVSKWVEGTSGAINILPTPGDDPSVLLFDLVATENNDESNTAIVQYVFCTNGFKADDAMIVMASICYQMLIQKPHLFHHVSVLLEALRKLDEDGIWPANKLFILFRALLSCPHEGKTTCVLWERPGTRFPEEVLDQLVTQAARPKSNYKLAIIRGNAHEAPSEWVHLPEIANLETIVDDALDAFLESRPGLKDVRTPLRDGLLSHYNNRQADFIGHDRTASDIFHVWLDLITRLAVPVSASSLKAVMPQMSSSVDDLYMQALRETCHFSKSKLADILAWISLPLIPLTVAELSTALALDDSVTDVEDLEPSMPVDLEADLVTGLGVAVSIFDWKRPFHKQDLTQILARHLSETSETNLNAGDTVDDRHLLAKAHFRLAQLCLAFLRLYRTKAVVDLASSLDDYPLLWCAVTIWPFHYAEGKRMSDERDRVPLEFIHYFDDDCLIKFWADMHQSIQHPGILHTPSALCAAAEVGCIDLIQSLMKPSGDEAHSAALLAAIDRADTETVAFLHMAGVTSPFSLHAAVSSGQRGLLKHIVPTKETLSVFNPLGYLPLHCACQDGTLEIVDDLILAGADIWVRSHDEQLTPLHIACMFSHVSVIRRLVDKDASCLEARDANGRTPLDCACEYQQPDAVNALLAIPGVLERLVLEKDDPKHLPSLHFASRTGRVDIVKILLGISHDTDTVSAESCRDIVDRMCTRRDGNGSTALHLAARGGHVAVTRELLGEDATKKGAITTEDHENNLPLHLSSREGHARIVELLLNYSSTDQLSSSGDGENRMKPIHLAVRHGHVDVVRVLVEAHARNKVSLDHFDALAYSPLHYAALRGHDASMQLLVEKGATMDIVNYNGETPLHLACRHGFEGVALLLIYRGADVTLSDKNGMTPILDAARAGNIIIMKRLAEAGASWDDKDSHHRNVLHYVVSSSFDAFTFVLEVLGQSDTGITLHDKDDDGVSALEVSASGIMMSKVLDRDSSTINANMLNDMLRAAASAGHLENVEYLVTNKKASPEDIDGNRRTALSFAAEKGHLQVVKFLAARTPTAQDSLGNTPLHYASEKGHDDVVSVLLAAPDTGGISVKNDECMTPIAMAVSSSCLNVTKLLLDKGADPNTSVNGNSLLHMTCASGSPEILECLLNTAGVNGEVKDKYGCTPTYVAVHYGKNNMLRQLIKAKWLANFPQGTGGYYPLHLAYWQPKVIKLLLDQPEIDVNVQDGQGGTVLHYASSVSCLDAVDVLLQRGADASILNLDGNSAFHLTGSVAILEKLISSISSTPDKDWKQMKNNNGHNVFIAALSKGRTSIVEYLLNQDNGDSWITNEALEMAITKPDTEVITRLCGDWPEDFLNKTDEHGWTYADIINSVTDKDGGQTAGGQTAGLSNGPCGLPLRPSALAFTGEGIELSSVPGQEGPLVRARYEEGYRAIALANHPVPLNTQFYFTLRVIREVERIVGVGVARRGCPLTDKFPGWTDDSWGLHGDDGGLFHADGWSVSKSADWEYGIGHEIGVFIDTRKQKVFYSINKEIVGTGFENVRGPLFPAIGLGPGCEVEVTFGSPDGTDPFKDDDGVDQMSKVTNWIG